jgi:signal transduction histidine kinase
MPIPVSASVDGERLPPAVESTAYFVVAEALTNVLKHSQAQSARVQAGVAGGELCLEVHDDGVGGARRSGGGLLGLEDRVGVLDGTLDVRSPPGGGTVVAARIPLAGQLSRR